MKHTHLTRFILLSFLSAGIASAYQSRNAIILVIDGARYSETFGDSTHGNIPVMWNTLRPISTIFTQFYNDGITNTCPGHSSIVTGAWQNIPNDGSIRPYNPTIFEYYRKAFNAPQSDCYVILGKPKLDILAYGTGATYGEQYGASVIYCDNYHDDILTWNNIREVLSNRHPRLAIVNLGQVDGRGHSGDWPGYLAAIHQADSIVGLTWNLIRNDPFYKDRTTLFVTNDHGREQDFFESHGTQSLGSRHIICLMAGPDTPTGFVDSTYRQQIDIAPTIGDIIGFALPHASGKTLLDIDPPQTPIPVAPLDTTDALSGNVSLMWHTSQGALMYHLEVATDDEFTGALLNDSLLTDTSRMVAHLRQETTYHWRIRAKNNAGSSNWSPTFRFSTAKILQPEIQLLEPHNGALMDAKELFLRWKSTDAEVNRYWIEIAADSLMEALLVSDSQLVLPEYLFDPPKVNKRLWWRVRTGTVNGWADWSERRIFSVIVSLLPYPNISCDVSLHKNATSKLLRLSILSPSSAGFTIAIADLQGKKLRSLNRSKGTRGRNTAHIDISDLPPGCYLATFSMGTFSMTRKLVF